MKILTFIFILFFNFTSFAQYVPSQADFLNAKLALIDYLSKFKIVDAEILCEDYNGLTKQDFYIKCNATFELIRTDSIDLEEDGVHQKNIVETCNFTYSYDINSALISELDGECN